MTLSISSFDGGARGAAAGPQFKQDNQVTTYQLTDQDNQLINQVVDEIIESQTAAGAPMALPSLEELVIHSSALPLKLIQHLRVFRLKSNSDVLLQSDRTGHQRVGQCGDTDSFQYQ